MSPRSSSRCRTAPPHRICSGYEIMSQRPCWVFSLGSHGQSDFEEAIRAQYPHCNIHIYDPTISIEVAQAVEARTQVPSRWPLPWQQLSACSACYEAPLTGDGICQCQSRPLVPAARGATSVCTPRRPRADFSTCEHACQTHAGCNREGSACHSTLCGMNKHRLQFCLVRVT